LGEIRLRDGARACVLEKIDKHIQAVWVTSGNGHCGGDRRNDETEIELIARDDD
jgi:hypothetical protein